MREGAKQGEWQVEKKGGAFKSLCTFVLRYKLMAENYQEERRGWEIEGEKKKEEAHRRTGRTEKGRKG